MATFSCGGGGEGVWTDGAEGSTIVGAWSSATDDGSVTVEGDVVTDVVGSVIAETGWVTDNDSIFSDVSNWETSIWEFSRTEVSGSETTDWTSLSSLLELADDDFIELVSSSYDLKDNAYSRWY